MIKLSSEAYKYLKSLIETNSFVDSSRTEFSELKEYELISHVSEKVERGSYSGYKANAKGKSFVRERKRRFLKPLSYLALTIIAGLVVYILGALLMPSILQLMHQTSTMPSPT